MTLPLLPEPAMVYMESQGYSMPCYTSEQMLKFRAETVWACAAVCEQQIDKERVVGFEVARIFETAHKIRGLLI